MSLYLGNNLISGTQTLVGESRNIGQIIPSSLPLTDAGLHLLDGSLIQGSGIYSAFVDYIAELYNTDPTANYFTDETSWQSSITQYGVCGKFVYDSTLNTVRLPKVTGKIDGTTDLSALGDLAPLMVKLPNITGTMTRDISEGSATGALSITSSYNGAMWSGDVSLTRMRNWDFNASRSSSVYSGNGTDTTIHEQAINVLLYIVIATSTKTDIEVDIDEIATDLNGKVDISDLQEVQCVVETYVNGTSWYRVYSDGWCKQGGRATISSYYANITFLKQFLDTNYNIGFAQNSVSEDTYCANVESFTNSTMRLRFRGGGTFCFWQACGYIEV